MRIVGGYLKGRTIASKANLDVRPTTNFAKEALFNILSNKLNFDGLNVLELYAGAGNMTFEFISRGVTSVTAVDLQGDCIRSMQKSARMLDVQNLTTVKADAIDFLRRSKLKNFDLLFADPPYAETDYDLLYSEILKSGKLNQNGWLILEHDKKVKLNQKTYFVEERKYGHVHFSLFFIAPDFA